MRTMGPAVAFVGASGAWQGFGMTCRATLAAKVPLVWRSLERLEGLAAAPVGGYGAWPGFGMTCRAKLAVRTARGRAAAHGAVRPSRAHQACLPHSVARRRPEYPWGPLIDTRIQAECPASRVARWTPPRPASWAAWVRHEKPSARYTASGCADRDGSRECDATATDRS